MNLSGWEVDCRVKALSHQLRKPEMNTVVINRVSTQLGYPEVYFVPKDRVLIGYQKNVKIYRIDRGHSEKIEFSGFEKSGFAKKLLPIALIFVLHRWANAH